MEQALLPAAGTYVLWLCLDRDTRVRVGALGAVDLPAGIYAYIGSAHGPGGVRARLGRHCKRDKKRRWHIDYLRRVSRVQGAWVSYDSLLCEHHWARLLGEMPGAEHPVAGFGASDCRCQAHLIRYAEPPSFQDFSAKTAVCGESLVEIHPKCD